MFFPACAGFFLLNWELCIVCRSACEWQWLFVFLCGTEINGWKPHLSRLGWATEVVIKKKGGEWIFYFYLFNTIQSIYFYQFKKSWKGWGLAIISNMEKNPTPTDSGSQGNKVLQYFCYLCRGSDSTMDPFLSVTVWYGFGEVLGSVEDPATGNACFTKKWFHELAFISLISFYCFRKNLNKTPTWKKDEPNLSRDRASIQKFHGTNAAESYWYSPSS